MEYSPWEVEKKSRQKTKEAQQKKYISERELHEAETVPALIKILSYPSVLYELPIALWYNYEAKKQGMPTKPIWGGLGSHELSDPLEMRNPALMTSRSFQSWKPWMNIASALALDPSSYIGVGLTDLGTTAMRVGREFTTEAVEGAVKYIPKAVREGTVFGGALTADIATRANNPKLWDKLSKGGWFTKPLPVLPGTVEEQVRQGYRGIKMFDKVVSPEKQAMIIEAASKAGDNIGAFMSKNFPEIKAAFTSINDVEEYLTKLDDINGTDLAHQYRLMVRDNDLITRMNKDFGIEAKEFNETVSAMRMRQAKQANMTLDDYLKTLDEVDATGLTQAERRQLINVYNLPNSKRIVNDDIYADVFSFKGGKANRISVKIGTLDPKFMTDYKEIVDVVKKHATKKFDLQQLRKAAIESTHLEKANLDDYILGQMKQLPKTKEGFKQSNRLNILLKQIKGKARKYRGPTLLERNKLINQQRLIAKGKEFTEQEKVVASLVNDTRIAGGESKVSDIIEFYGKEGLGTDSVYREKISQAIKAGDTDLADVLKSTKEFVENINEYKATLSKSGDSLFTKAIDDVNIGNVFSRAETKNIHEYYNMNVPLLDYFSRYKTEKEIRALNFFQELFVGGSKPGYSRVMKAGETADDYVNLEKYIGMSIADDGARKLLGDAYEVGQRYYWALKKDIFDYLQATQVFAKIEQPAKTFTQNVMSGLWNAYKKMMRVWKETTLFPFPAYHFRNFIDNNIRVALEYAPDEMLSGKMLDDMHEALKMLEEFSDAKPSKFWFGGALPSGGKAKAVKMFGGGEMSAKEFMDIAMERGIMGDGVREFGLIGDDPIRTLKYRLQSAIGNDNKLKDEILSLMERPTFADNVPSSFRQKYREYLNKSIAVSQLIESTSRLQLFRKYLGEMPVEEAVKKVGAVMIDYADMGEFERNVIQQIIPFYSFKKGAAKYIMHKFAQDPKVFAQFREGIELAQEMTTAPDEELNRAFYPEWLKESGVQIGMTSEGEPYILNFRGMTTLAEVLTFLQPWQTLKESLAPGIKMLVESLTNKDFYFKKPISSYPDERRLIMGIDVPVSGPLGIIPAVSKNIRAVRFAEDISNVFADRLFSKIAGKEVSLMGRKGVKSFFGLGTVGTLNADAINTFMMKKVIGMPVYEVDIEKAQTAKFWRVKDYEKEMGKGLSRADVRYSGDKKSYDAYAKRHTSAMDKYYEHMKREKLSDIYPRSTELSFLNQIGLDKNKKLFFKRDTLEEKLRKRKVAK